MALLMPASEPLASMARSAPRPSVRKRSLGINRDGAMAEYVAPLIVMVINLPINFLLNKFWAYREKGSKG